MDRAAGSETTSGFVFYDHFYLARITASHQQKENREQPFGLSMLIG